MQVASSFTVMRTLESTLVTTRGLFFLLFLLISPLDHFKQVQCVSTPEHQWLKDFPYLLISPMLAEDVSRIDPTVNVVETQHFRCDGLTDPMEGQRRMTLVKPGVWDRTALDDRFIVAEHVALVTDWDSKVAKGRVEINNLFRACVGCRKLTAVCGGLDCALLLAVPIDQCVVGKVENPCDQPSCNKIMIQVGINIMAQGHPVSQRLWSIFWLQLGNISMVFIQSNSWSGKSEKSGSSTWKQMIACFIFDKYLQTCLTQSKCPWQGAT